MTAVEIVIVLGAAIVAGTVIARRTGIAAPIVLVVMGLLASLIPGVHGIELPAEGVLVLFLPALLFWESLTISAREMRRFVRGISLTGILLVIVTAGAVAGVAHLCGLPWSIAWLIGAAVAPTDATAVAALGGLLPLRTLTILRAESLINDGTALVIYALALEAATGDSITVGHVSGLFVLSFVGGVLSGLLVGTVIFEVRRRATDPTLNSTLMVIAPFAAYYLAEQVHASGVLAVVTCGLLWARRSPGVISAASRQQSAPFWTLTTFLLNGALFVLIGIELPIAISGLTPSSVRTGLLVALGVYVVMEVTRFVFLIVSAYLIRALDRRPQQRELRTTNRARAVSATAGFRGAVSLAVALAVPSTHGIDRDMVVFVTALVVVATLVIQGLALPHVIRWANLPQDTTEEDELELAWTRSVQEALDALPDIAAELNVDCEVRETVEKYYSDQLAESMDGEGHSEIAEHDRQERDLRLALITRNRDSMVRLRNEGVIDDSVLRHVQARLDIGEVRLTGPASVE